MSSRHRSNPRPPPPLFPSSFFIEYPRTFDDDDDDNKVAVVEDGSSIDIVVNKITRSGNIAIHASSRVNNVAAIAILKSPYCQVPNNAIRFQ